MGAISPSKMPKAKKVTRTDSPESVDSYAQGGLYENKGKTKGKMASGSRGK